MKFLKRGIESTTVRLTTNVIRKHHCLITDKAPFLKICIYLYVIGCLAVRPKMCPPMSAHTLSEAIYISCSSV